MNGRLLYIRSKSRTTNPDIIKTIAQKFFAYFFTKKYGAYFLQKSRLQQNFAQKNLFFFAGQAVDFL